MPAYDATLFNPPAPLARVTLHNLGNGATLADVPMLLDSGADVTLIPQASVDQLGVAVVPNKHYELMGFDGSTSLASVWSTTLGAWVVDCARLPAPLVHCRSGVALRARHHRLLPTLMSGWPSTPRGEVYHSQSSSSGGTGSTTSVWRVHSLMGRYHSLLAPPNQWMEPTA
jgi:hypothetical protein